MIKKKIWLILKKVLKSRMFVVGALLVLLLGFSVSKAKAQYQAGTVYQYYLLGTRADDVQSNAKDGKILHMGSLGSGGVSGTFSYDDIVNSASVGTDEEKKTNSEEAKKFSSIMATYSTFHYFSNRIEGFSSILSYIGRALSSVILIPEALILDVLSTVVPLFVSLIAKLNVITYLATMLTNLEIFEKGTVTLTDALGISKEQFQTGAGAFLSFAVAMIVLSLAMMFKPGGRIDQRHYSKFKGRLFSIVAIPLVIGIGATFIKDIMGMTSTSSNSSTAFSRYLVDDRSWAYNFNFAPNGNDDQDGDIQGNSSSYVDLHFDPYTKEGEDRIKQINENSSLTQSIGGKANYNFSNTSLAIAFVMSDAFSAQDYINYKGTEASQSLYGKADSSLGGTFGSYYQYAINQQDTLGNVSKSYTPSKGEEKKDRESDVEGSYKSAIGDYAQDNKLTVNPSIAWRDRFIYGAKTSGDNLDKYYGAKPSFEQMQNGVGTNNGSAFSDQSMYLILSTMFGETGGKYYIDAPARGIMQAKASFDSNRSTYYVVSMVGDPFFTMFGMVAKPLVQLIALAACVCAVMTMGLLDMNLRPLSAWVKGSTLGDIEYSWALLVYSVGIGGTIISLTILPDIFVTVVDYIPKIISIGLEPEGVSMQTPQASLAFHGIGLIFEAVVGLTMGYLFIKSAKFRNRLIDLFTFCWSWARVTGENFERQASSAGQRISRDQKTMNDKREQLREQFWSKARDKFTPGKKTNTNSPYSPEGGGVDGFGAPEEQVPLGVRDIAKNGVVERSMNTLYDLDESDDEQVKDGSIRLQNDLEDLEKNPTKDNFNDVLASLSDLQQKVNQSDDENIDNDSNNQLERTREELFDLAEQYGFKVDGLTNSVTEPESSPSPEFNEGPNTVKTTEFKEVPKSSPSSGGGYQAPPQEPVIHNHIVYENTEVKNLATAFGSISNNEQIEKALSQLDKANDHKEVQHGFAGLQDAVDNLDLSERKEIDVEKVSRAIDDILKSNQNN
ncbi:hypothetical protein [Lactococcus lactis]|uniref:hypothetical protein n=1 Tax=Lactococcus lactis TaxID=1358 RepID=UPI001911D22D|nr:hypothetical protein [Lactococcus lactis]WDA67446.1 hypothetical protein IL310_01385 [Lactococcus lactis]WDA67483.1 hypothetical protein IL310_00990 [Lactococcus lactis]